MSPTNDAPVTVEQCDAFWARVDRRGDDECWAWLGGRGSTDNAYGRIHIDGRMRPASQVSWEIANSVSFPSGKVACHRCDNPICVNPTHIWPGTQSDNIRDCSEKGRLHLSVKTTCKRGHQLTEKNRKAIRNGSRCLTCQREANRRWKQRSTAKAKGAAA